MTTDVKSNAPYEFSRYTSRTDPEPAGESAPPPTSFISDWISAWVGSDRLAWFLNLNTHIKFFICPMGSAAMFS